MWRSSAAKAVSSGKAGRAEADMSNKFGEAKNSLFDGLARFERVIRELKARQISQTRNTPILNAGSEVFGLSPEEIWSKKYMTAAIGPVDPKLPQGAQLPAAFSLADQVFAMSSFQTQSPPLARDAAANPATIGQALAKPVRRRSWLVRMVWGG